MLENERQPILTTSTSNKSYSSAVSTEAHAAAASSVNDSDVVISSTSKFAPILSDVIAGLTVSLINIPLSIALAVASQSSPMAGVITAVWAGLTASILGGGQFNISGPTGALTGILGRYALLFGASSLPILSITAAILMFVIWALNWDKYVTYLPSAIIHGFTVGVAIILALGQVPSILALPPLPQHEQFVFNIYESITHAYLFSPITVAVFFVAWLSLFSLVRRYPGIPWSVGLAFLGIIIGYLSTIGYVPRLMTLRDKYGELQVQLYRPISIPLVMYEKWPDVVSASMSIAFVAVLESLISGKIADGMTKTVMNQRRETLGVTAANLVSGLFGGIPATAALARTALSIRSGAVSRLSGIVNALCSLIIATIAMPFFGYMPLCIISALLVQVAVGMVEAKHLVKAYSIDFGAFALILLVAALCIILDPTMAIVIGAIAGLLRFAQSSAVGYSEVTLTTDMLVETQVDMSNDPNATVQLSADNGSMCTDSCLGLFSGDVIAERTAAVHDHISQSNVIRELDPYTNVYRIVGDFTYLSALSHTQRLQRLECDNVILSLRYCYYVDLDGLDALDEIMTELQTKHKRVLVCGISPLLLPKFKQCHWFVELSQNHGIFDLVKEAVASLMNDNAFISNADAPGDHRSRRLSFDGEGLGSRGK